MITMQLIERIIAPFLVESIREEALGDLWESYHKLNSQKTLKMVSNFITIWRAILLVKSSCQIAYYQARLRLFKSIKKLVFNILSLDSLEKTLSQSNLDDKKLATEMRLIQLFHKLTSFDDRTAISDYITWGEYQLFLDAQKIGQFHSSAEILPIPPGQESQPVTGISEKDARWFCAWLSTLTSLHSENVMYDYRLPTEAEIDKAVRQGIIDNPAPQSNCPVDFLRVARVQLPKHYKALLNYLAKGHWYEADQETGDVMLEIAGQKERGYLTPDDIEKFPHEDLHIINQLWLKFSGDRFGFSVQKDIYQSLGGTKDSNEEIWNNFGDRVGWRKGGKWLNYSDLTWDLNAPKGHLPVKRIEKELSDHDRLKFLYISAIAQKKLELV